MKFIENINSPGIETTKKAALYFKTDPFFMDVTKYVHTNNWEILQSIRLLNSKGYSVDLIDRTNHDWVPNKTYDLFLGLGVGNTGRNFTRHAIASCSPKKVLLAMGPDRFDDLVSARYDNFYKRTGKLAPPMRLAQELTTEVFNKIIETTDYILTIGEKETLSYKSFLKYNKPLLNFLPSVSPELKFDNNWLQTRDINSFLCFSGNGFICKGVDIVIEAFLKMPDKELHICGPNSEQSFNNHFGALIASSPNIKYHGFIEPGGSVFNNLASKCSFIIFHSSAEACATSVASSMKAGLVPVINPWTNIGIEDNVNGILMSDEGDLIENIVDKVRYSSSISKEQYKLLVENNNKNASKFSQESFTQSYSKALDYIIEN